MTAEDILMDRRNIKIRDSLRHILNGMKQRCSNENNPRYKDYGGKGIRVCDEWANGKQGFRSFVQWSMKHGYIPSLTLDRIDPNGNYEPDNCRWISRANNSAKGNYCQEAEDVFVRNLIRKLNWTWD